MKNILVIGSKGFIGNNLVETLQSKEYVLFGIDIVESNVDNYMYQKISILSSDFFSFMSNNKFDLVINCSGSGNVKYSVENPLSDYELNTLGVFHILEAIRKTQSACRYFHISSAAVYGNPSVFPVSENSTINPISPYGYHKWQSEIICKEYFDLYKIPMLIMRPFSVYGPGLKKQLLWDIFLKVKQSAKVELFGTGKETRDFIFIKDMCEIITDLISLELPKYEILNLASGHAVAIEDISRHLLKNLGIPSDLKFNGQFKAGDPIFWQADISALLEYGLCSKTSIESGLLQTSEWMIKNG